MGEMQILMAALLLCTVILVEFFVLAHRMNYLKMIGRKPASSRDFLIITAASLLPVICFFICEALAPMLREVHEALVATGIFTAVGVACHAAMQGLWKISGKKESAPKK